MKRELENIDQIEGWSTENYLVAKQELNEIEKGKCKGAVIRSKIKYMYEGEKCTSFFLGMEKRKQGKMWLNGLEKNGRTLRETDEILIEVQDFFEKLYEKRDCDSVELNRAIGVLKRKLSIVDREWCERKITVEEIETALKSLNKGKSPGKDGLTTEFFQQFQVCLIPMLCKIIENVERGGSLPENFKQGIITIVYKNKGGRENLKNYRPISLLNTDYKILTKILANRLKSIIDTVIGKSQTYSIPERSIHDTIITLDEINRYMGDREGIWLGLDLEKAFDRVEHNFLFKVMEKLGLGENFVGWTEKLYTNAKSQIKCNGVLSEGFKIERSVRQGCPLSALLFCIAVEPLAELINNDEGIVGIGLEGGEKTKTLLYADDIHIMVRNEEELNKVMTCIKMYEKASGAKVNLEKSEITYYGEALIRKKERGFVNVQGERKTLGVYIGGNIETANKKTWDAVVSKMKSTLGAVVA